MKARVKLITSRANTVCRNSHCGQQKCPRVAPFDRAASALIRLLRLPVRARSMHHAEVSSRRGCRASSHHGALKPIPREIM
jgi:hypothetical protein